jgi:hypothetical protein
MSHTRKQPDLNVFKRDSWWPHWCPGAQRCAMCAYRASKEQRATAAEIVAAGTRALARRRHPAAGRLTAVRQAAHWLAQHLDGPR